MKKVSTLCAYTALALLLTYSTVQAATYSVDKNGSGSFTTIQACLTSTNTKPGDTCLVQPGVYTENLSFPRAGAAGQLIRLQAQYPFNRDNTANRSIVQGGISLRAYNGVYGMEFVNSGISIDGSGAEVVGNFVHGAGDQTAGVGINILRTPSSTPYHANLIVKDNYLTQITYGMLIFCSDNCLIENNDIERLYTPVACRPTGVCPGDVDHVRIFGDGIIFRGNKIHGSSLAEIDEDAHVDGIQTFTNGGLGGQGRDTLSNTIIENNLIQDCHQAIWWTTATTSYNGSPISSHHVTLRNNIFLNTWGTSARMSIGGAAADELYIYNNVFGQSVRITAKTRALIKNNFFFSNLMNTANDSFAWPQASFEITNNIFFFDGWLNKVIAKIPAMTATNIFDPIKESIFVDLLQRDFRLKAGSPAIDKGLNLSQTGFSNDRVGTARPQGSSWDIGAYEFISDPMLTPNAPTGLRTTN